MRSGFGPNKPNEHNIPGVPSLTVMGQAAAQLHEAYTAYVEAGFAPHQALYLVGLFVSNARPQEPTPPPGHTP